MTLIRMGPPVSGPTGSSGIRLRSPGTAHRAVVVEQLVVEGAPRPVAYAGHGALAPSPGAAARCSTRRSTPAAAARRRHPVGRGSRSRRHRTRSTGPPARGATTGTPEASASCADWQNVSVRPVCTNTSREATTEARSSPCRTPEQRGPGEQGAQPLLLGSAADEHQPGAGQVVQVGEQLELLLSGEPADVTDEQVSAVAELAAHALVCDGRGEQLGVHAAAPAVDPVDARGRRAGRRWPCSAPGCGRRDRAPAGSGRASRADRTRERIALGEADQVGLVDRDDRDARGCGPPPPPGARARPARPGARRRVRRRPSAGAGVPGWRARSGTPGRWASPRCGRGGPALRRTPRARRAPPASPRARRPGGARAPGVPSW